MSRPVGNKNKPKTAAQLLKSVESAYAKQGKKMTVTIEDLADLSDEQKTEIATAAAENPNLTVPLDFELSGDGEEDEDEEKLICGNCHNELDREYSTCPHCGTPLTWG